jgi:hypothetical protein
MKIILFLLFLSACSHRIPPKGSYGEGKALYEFTQNDELKKVHLRFMPKLHHQSAFTLAHLHMAETCGPQTFSLNIYQVPDFDEDEISEALLEFECLKGDKELQRKTLMRLCHSITTPTNDFLEGICRDHLN